jgi:DNA-binding transcriptional MocR family regulator
MNKKEIIWREILFQATENKKTEFTQKELAQKYSFSLSTVFNALKIPRNSGMIEVKGRGFEVQDMEKFLYLWATFRKLKKEVIYQTSVPKSVREIEGEMPSGIIFGVFSAYFKKYREAPADYDRVYVYMKKENIKEIQDRFPPRKGNYNLIVLTADPWLENFGKVTPDCQTFVDLWNLSEWYAKDYLNALKDKISK